MKKSKPSKDLNGIKGWLKFVVVMTILGIVLTPVVIGLSIYSYLQLIEAARVELPGLLAVTIFESVVLGLTAIIDIWVLRLMLKKKREVPNLMIILTWAGLGLSILLSFLHVMWGNSEGLVYFEDWFINKLNATEWSSLTGGLLGALIWTTYFKKSKRVKATFVN